MSTTTTPTGGPGTVPPRGSATKEQVLQHAATLIREKGFRSTSISDVLERAGIQKGSFYYYFPSKEDLGHAVLDRWSNDLKTGLLDPLTAPEGPPPLERITHALEGFLADTEANGCRGGCAFGNLAIELADVHEGFRARLSESFRTVASAFSHLIDRAKATGQVRADADSRALGEFLVASIEGGILLAKVHKSCAPLASTLHAAEAHLASHRTGR